jgi:hypothetical protein
MGFLSMALHAARLWKGGIACQCREVSQDSPGGSLGLYAGQVFFGDKSGIALHNAKAWTRLSVLFPRLRASVSFNRTEEPLTSALKNAIPLINAVA